MEEDERREAHLEVHGGGRVANPQCCLHCALHTVKLTHAAADEPDVTSERPHDPVYCEMQSSEVAVIAVKGGNNFPNAAHGASITAAMT